MRVSVTLGTSWAVVLGGGSCVPTSGIPPQELPPTCWPLCQMALCPCLLAEEDLVTLLEPWWAPSGQHDGHCSLVLFRTQRSQPGRQGSALGTEARGVGDLERA